VPSLDIEVESDVEVEVEVDFKLFPSYLLASLVGANFASTFLLFLFWLLAMLETKEGGSSSIAPLIEDLDLGVVEVVEVEVEVEVVLDLDADDGEKGHQVVLEVVGIDATSTTTALSDFISNFVLLAPPLFLFLVTVSAENLVLVEGADVVVLEKVDGKAEVTLAALEGIRAVDAFTFSL
jgi:hypothetical protein